MKYQLITRYYNNKGEYLILLNDDFVDCDSYTEKQNYDEYSDFYNDEDDLYQSVEEFKQNYSNCKEIYEY